MDILSDLVRLLRLRSHSYGQLVLGSPFAVALPPEGGHFLVVLDGRCSLRIGDKPVALLATGDFAFLPAKESFNLSSSAEDGPARRFSGIEEESYRRTGRITVEGDFAAGAHIVSGCFEFLPQEAQLLRLLFDGPLIARTTGGLGTPAMASTFQIIAEEAREMRVGAFNIMDRLSEVLLIQALRRRLDDPGQENRGWLAALRDPRISMVLSAMHFDPGRDWTVATLAQLCGMSRSAFAEHFRNLVGVAPMEHLGWWRMQKAGLMLADNPPAPVSQIVPALGYRSEAAFRRKFLETMGATPANFRRLRQASVAG